MEIERIVERVSKGIS